MANIEKIMDNLPVWNRKLAEGLSPLEPYANWVLIGLAISCVLAIIYLRPQYKLLYSAFLICP